MTEKDDKFSFWFEGIPTGGDLRAMTKEQAEQWYLEKIEEGGGKDAHLMEQLLILYLHTEETEKATSCVQRLFEILESDGERSYLLFRLGQISEQTGDYSAAERFYRDSHSMNPPHPDIQYWVNNNLGYCLNVLGRPGEAETYLKSAIELYPTRSNAFKNLGLCYQALGRLADAVEQFIAATRANAADRRSLSHLEKLLQDHPEFHETVPNLSERLENCRAAVAYADSMAPDYKAYWRKMREERRKQE